MNMKIPNWQSFWQRLVTAPLAGLMAANLFPSPTQAVELDVRRDAAVDAIEKVLPSVVNIATATIVEYHDFYDTLLHQFYGVNRPSRRQEQPELREKRDRVTNVAVFHVQGREPQSHTDRSSEREQDE